MERDYRVGVQSVVFAEFTLEALLAEVESTGIEHLELWGHHLSPADDVETVAAGEHAIAESDVSICGYGVVNLEEPGQVAEHVGFADRLGAGYVTVNYPPDRDDVTEALLEAAEAHDVDVGIHNYSTVHHDDLSSVFSSVDDVRDVLARYHHPRLGVCVDTGHFLVMDRRPADVVPALGERIVAVHLKDTSADELEDVPGAGRLDLEEFLDLLDEHAALDAPLVIEYELPADRATAALEEADAAVRAAMGR